MSKIGIFAGDQQKVFVPSALVHDGNGRAHAYACALLALLQTENGWGATFPIGNNFVTEKLGGPNSQWSRRKFVRARRALEERGYLVMVSKPRRGRPAEYRFGPGFHRERIKQTVLAMTDDLVTIAQAALRGPINSDGHGRLIDIAFDLRAMYGLPMPWEEAADADTETHRRESARGGRAP